MNCSCAICTDLLEDAVTIRECEHTFCGPCLDGWIVSQMDENNVPCPECRTIFSKDDVKLASRFIRNMLSEIQLTCPFETCGTTVGYGKFNIHQLACEYNPDVKLPCIGCEQQYTKETLPDHEENCILYIRYQMSELQVSTDLLKTELAEIKSKESGTLVNTLVNTQSKC